MRKGSPQDYTAETGCSKQPTQKSRLGEPHECYSLYRIRRTQENHQFLRKDGRRPDCGRRQTASGADGVAALGGGSKTSLDRMEGRASPDAGEIAGQGCVMPALRSLGVRYGDSYENRSSVLSSPGRRRPGCSV